MMGYGDMAGYGWLWMALGIGFWITVAVIAARVLIRPDRPESTSATAEEILRRRYAAGEINENDFESARRALRRN